MMDRNLSFRLPDDAQNVVKREAGGLSACEGAWQRVARRRWRDHLLGWFGLVSMAVHTVPCARLLPSPLEHSKGAIL